MSMPRELPIRTSGEGGPPSVGPPAEPLAHTVLNTFKGLLSPQKGQPTRFRRPTGPNSL
ncbi:hypothetical protein SAM23877_3142 [Streptomyces ambofaciens ATCC 23877]|uniref:Uncharacterized protein n=1 Tax=Streptomyces ambofaciens (strain ATCC 23877 / 3486 / DSM 40053 / JCM 4204 / NBRC 12836 / NRRL B-2516) TaxID=278992 RepID=A0A0K2ATD3_STRA7|nr:hypothetical protein SAM23877_3142 [Streptomyces ambofaciens ATCC 23877]